MIDAGQVPQQDLKAVSSRAVCVHPTESMNLVIFLIDSHKSRFASTM
jgi:hypothetical protein